MIKPLFFYPGTQQVKLGPDNGRICRFCEKDDTKTKFRRKAHAIPEYLGNRHIFSNYECDDCNQFFGHGIENDLGNWTKPSRTFSIIRGKRGVPSIKKHGTGQVWRIDYKNDGLQLKHYESDPQFEIDEKNRQVKCKLIRDVYTPVAVLKAFVKIGLTLLPPQEVPNFKEALSWICEPDHTKPFEAKYSIFHTFQPGPMRNDLLVAMLYRRRESIVKLPYAFLVLGFGNDVYQVFIPSSKLDREIQDKQPKIPPFPTPGSPSPEKFGSPRKETIDLCGRHPVEGEIVSVVMGFESMNISK